MNYLFNPALDRVYPSGIRTYTAMAKAVPGCIMLTIGEPDFDTPINIKKAAVSALERGDTHYPQNAGDMYLRQAICDYDKRYSPEETIVTVGSTEGFMTALTTIICPGDEVIIPTPAFGLYEQLTYIAGGEPRFLDISETGFQIDKASLLSAITPRTKAIILTSPNNPTGTVFDNSSLEAVRTAVKDTDIFVLCDEVYSSLYYGEKLPRFSDFEDMRERVIVLNSFSKTWAMTGWRLGWISAPEAVIKKAALVHAYGVVSVASFSQPACVEALATDPSPMREIYRRRRDYVSERLEKMGFRFPAPEGAFYIFPKISHLGISDGELTKRLIKEAGVAVTPGSCFGTPGYIRLSYACSDDELKEGLNRIEAFTARL